MYTIGQVSKMFDLPISTIRFYDKKGLFPEIKRESGIRKFDYSELEALRVIECLKKSGLEIKDIKQYMDWCKEGNASLTERRELFLKQKANLEAEIAHLNNILDMINFKCWYYDEAIKRKDETAVLNMIPNQLPNEVQELYANTH